MSRAWRFALDHYLVLPLGAGVAVVWANIDGASYFQVSEKLAFAVNDVGMAFALAYLAQEVVEAALPGGSLHPWRRSIVPVIAGAGGSLGAVAVYAAYIRTAEEQVLAQGWPIACGVDIVLCLALARFIFGRTVAATFLVLVAITGDVIGLMMISRHRLVTAVHPGAMLLIACAFGACIAIRRIGARSMWPYVLIAGPLIWLGCYGVGVHPALALLPIVPFFPHAPRNLIANPHPDRGVHRRASHFESVFASPVQGVAFLFGLVNAGVFWRGYGTGTWAVLTASLAGRPLGILAAVGIAVAVGLPLPRDFGWKALVVSALSASVSLSFGLFFAAAVFPDGPLLIETKMGAAMTSAGVLVALTAARLLRVGRFADVARPRDDVDPQLARVRA